MRTVALIGTELYPIPPIWGGAAELFIDTLARHLTRYRPIIVSIGDPELPSHERQGQVEYFRVSLSGWRLSLYKRYRRFLPFYDRQVAKIIRKVQPDLVQVQNRPLLALRLKQDYCPALPVLSRLSAPYNTLGKRERPAPGTAMPVDAFIGCSRFVLEKERDRLGLGALSHWVVYSGIDCAAFAPPWQEPALARLMREKYGLGHEPTVLFVGKLRESKGVHLLLEAMHRVWQQLPEAVLILVGGTEFGRGRTDRETPFVKEFKKRLSAAPGRIVLTGFIPPDQVAQAFWLGDIFVGPSQIEDAFPRVILEAAASGLPLITTAQGGIPEMVQDGQTALILQKKDDVRELADKILALLHDKPLRERLGRQGRAFICENFSWDKIARQQEEVFDAVLDRTGVRNKEKAG